MIKYSLTLGGTIAETGDEQVDFDAGPAILDDERLLASLELDPSLKFFELLM